MTAWEDCTTTIAGLVMYFLHLFYLRESCHTSALPSSSRFCSVRGLLSSSSVVTVKDSSTPSAVLRSVASPPESSSVTSEGIDAASARVVPAASSPPSSPLLWGAVDEDGKAIILYLLAERVVAHHTAQRDNGNSIICGNVAASADGCVATCRARLLVLVHLVQRCLAVYAMFRFWYFYEVLFYFFLQQPSWRDESGLSVSSSSSPVPTAKGGSRVGVRRLSDVYTEFTLDNSGMDVEDIRDVVCRARGADRLTAEEEYVLQELFVAEGDAGKDEARVMANIDISYLHELRGEGDAEKSHEPSLTTFKRTTSLSRERGGRGSRDEEEANKWVSNPVEMEIRCMMCTHTHAACFWCKPTAGHAPHHHRSNSSGKLLEDVRFVANTILRRGGGATAEARPTSTIGNTSVRQQCVC